MQPLPCSRLKQLLRNEQKDQTRGQRENHGQQALQEKPRSQAGREQECPQPRVRFFFFESAKHRPHRERNGEREHDVRNQYAREEKQTDAGGHAKTSAKSRASAECPRAKSGRQQAKCDSGERNWDSGGPVVYAKYLVRKRHSQYTRGAFSR